MFKFTNSATLYLFCVTLIMDTTMATLRALKAAKKKKKIQQTHHARKVLKVSQNKQNLQQMINRLKSQLAQRDSKIRDLKKQLKNMSISNTKLNNSNAKLTFNNKNTHNNKLKYLKNEIQQVLLNLSNKLNHIATKKYVLFVVSAFYIYKCVNLCLHIVIQNMLNKIGEY